MFNRAYIEITNLCNFHCDFCPGTTRPPMAMRLSDFRTAAEKLRPLTDYLYLHVMGEPLLHPDLDKVLAICRELGFKTCITTNGLLLPKKLDILRDAPALHKLSISLHSYESNRPDVPLIDAGKSMPDAIGEEPSNDFNPHDSAPLTQTDAAASGGDGIVTEEQVQKGYV